MKKFVWIALASFFLGVLLAGYIFVYLPEKHAETSFLNKTSSPLGANLYAEAPQVKPDLDFVKVSEKLGPAVMKIESERVEKQSSMTFPDSPFGDDFWDRFFGRQQQRPQEYKMTVQGTGFFISNDGYILTNNHLVEKASKVKIFTVQGDEYTAKIIGTDPKTDLALIKVDTKNVPFAELGDSAQLKIGEWVLAIGNPLGMGISAKQGIVSRLGVSISVSSGQTLYDLVEISAAINPGNSGGPLFNMAGEVVGITSAKLSAVGVEGMGYAISSNTARPIIEELITRGYTIRPWLGVVLRSVNQLVALQYRLSVQQGALITEVAAGSPAAKAGLKVGDAIVNVNGKDITSADDLIRAIRISKIGETVTITYWRGNQKNSTSAILMESPKPS